MRRSLFEPEQLDNTLLFLTQCNNHRLNCLPSYCELLLESIADRFQLKQEWSSDIIRPLTETWGNEVPYYCFWHFHNYSNCLGQFCKRQIITGDVFVIVELGERDGLCCSKFVHPTTYSSCHIFILYCECV